MAHRFTLAALLLPLAEAGCGPSSSVQHTNATTTEQLAEISGRTARIDGASAAATPLTADDVGQSMRAGAATKPRP